MKLSIDESTNTWLLCIEYKRKASNKLFHNISIFLQDGNQWVAQRAETKTKEKGKVLIKHI
jgi:hypothetical protein